METNIHFYCLILFLICSQAIDVLSEDNIVNSSDLHVRKKRLINKSHEGKRTSKIKEIPYIVNILSAGSPNCGASILTANILLTAAHCVWKNNENYSILSGSEYVDRGIKHNITGKIIHPFYGRRQFMIVNDLALLHIFPPIDFIHSHNQDIQLYDGNVEAGIPATLSGWGCVKIGSKKKYPKILQSIVVPIMSQEKCKWHYSLPSQITDRNICTFDIFLEKFSCFGDSGGPLVVDGRLIGVLSWKWANLNTENPDVFMKVSHPLYRRWIMTNVQIIEGWI